LVQTCLLSVVDPARAVVLRPPAPDRRPPDAGAAIRVTPGYPGRRRRGV